MTHRAIPSQAVLVFALFSDVAADYFVETMAADVAASSTREYGDGVALADAQAEHPGRAQGGRDRRGPRHDRQERAVLLATASASTASSASCSSTRRSIATTRRRSGTEWKLPDCATCNLCVEACPVGAFDDYVITKVAVVRPPDRRRLLRPAPRSHVPRVHHALPGVERRAQAAPHAKAHRSARSGTTRPSCR